MLRPDRKHVFVLLLLLPVRYAIAQDRVVEESMQDVPRREVLEDIRALAADEQDRLQKAGGGEVADTPFSAAAPLDQKSMSLAGATAVPNPPILTVEGASQPAPQLWVHVRGQWSWRSDYFYQSKEYKVWAWVTAGRNGERVAVPKLEAAFRGVCDSKSKSWLNADYQGFSYSQRHKGLFPPGSGMCMPSNVCFEGCATSTTGLRWCVQTADCR